MPHSKYPLFLTVLACLAPIRSIDGSSTDHGCTDEVKECQKWAQGNECFSNPFYMRRECKKACRACGDADGSLHPQVVLGHATERATRQYALMLPSVSLQTGPGHFRKDPSMGTYVAPGQRVRSNPWLTLSSFGIGTYLGNEDDQTDEEVTSAIIKSVYRGLNVIDTASNYRNGRAERSVGAAIAGLQPLPGFSREMLFVSTKAGFVEASQLRQLRQQGRVADADVKGGVNCIAPACLEASLENSLRSLNLETVDLLYLHNVAEMSSGELQTPDFWERLSKAFKWLESARAKNLIRAYGMATWTCFRVRPEDPGFLSLQKIVGLAEQVGGKDHGFRYVQLPINAGMLEAAEKLWQPLTVKGAPSAASSVTLLQAAANLGVGVFASGPLGEGSLTADERLRAKVDESAALASLSTTPVKLLQIARSAPLLLSAVVGQKSKPHVEENLKLTRTSPMSEKAFWKAVGELRGTSAA